MSWHVLPRPISSARIAPGTPVFARCSSQLTPTTCGGSSGGESAMRLLVQAPQTYAHKRPDCGCTAQLHSASAPRGQDANAAA